MWTLCTMFCYCNNKLHRYSPHLEGQVLLFVHPNPAFCLGAVGKDFLCVPYCSSFKQIYPKNHRTAPFHASHKMKWHQLGTKLAFVTWEGGKCVCEGQGWGKLLKRRINQVPQCRQGPCAHHTPAVPAVWLDKRAREGLGPAVIRQQLKEAGVSLCHQGQMHNDDQSHSVLWTWD